MKKCSDCKYAILRDHGYSNYTVMGTDIDCLLHKNPKFPVDLGWSLVKELDFAEECDKFTEGECPHIDVDLVETTLEAYSDDPEIKELLKGY